MGMDERELDLEELLRRSQDRLRGGPLPPSTFADRIGVTDLLEEWREDRSWLLFKVAVSLALLCFGISAVCQLLILLM